MSPDDDTASKMFSTVYKRLQNYSTYYVKRKKVYHFTYYCKRLIHKINTSDTLMQTGAFNARLDNNKTEGNTTHLIK